MPNMSCNPFWRLIMKRAMISAVIASLAVVSVAPVFAAEKCKAGQVLNNQGKCVSQRGS